MAKDNSSTEIDNKANEKEKSNLEDEEKGIAALAHAGVFVAGILVPLIIFLLKGDESEFVKKSAKESMNFQITLYIYSIIAFVLVFLLIGFLLLPLIALGGFILVIVATIKYYEGEEYKYPLTIRLL